MSHAPTTNTIDHPENQSVLFEELKGYNLTPKLERMTDYFIVGYNAALGDDITYYSPNDEDWGTIIAVSEKHQLAHDTGFFEFDDMEDADSDYVQVVVNGVMGCRFEMEN